jgi:hypothetical protein
MANKTQESDADVTAFLAGVEPPERRADSAALAAIMARLSGEPPRLWGPSIIGFGRYHYRYDSGREGDAPRIAFAPRKNDLTLYLAGFAEDDDTPFARLGKHKRGKGCLHLRRLSAVDLTVLEGLIARSLDHMQARYPA